jgi:hypothetical protein
LIHDALRTRDRRSSVSRAALIVSQMNVASLSQAKMMRAIDAIAARVAPALHGEADA